MLATAFAIFAGLKSFGGLIAGAGALAGFASPFLGKHWKIIAIGAAGVVAFGLLFSWHISKVREARQQERAVCEMAKRESQETAAEIDRVNIKQTTDEHLAELEAERLRTLAAQSLTQEYQDEIDALPAQLQACRRATPADDRRVQRRD